MSDLTEYIKWRGDLSFEADAPNIIDALIFAELSQLPFENVVSSVEKEKYITIEESAKEFFLDDEKNKSSAAIIPMKEIKNLFKAVSECNRFKNVKIYGFENTINVKEEMQFSAVSFSANGSTFIAFRATDDTLVGWKEDFNMAIYAPIPSQVQGVEYVEKIARLSNDKITLCGHSKGGNVAVYSSLFCNDEIKERIEKVYGFDCPGFKDEIARKFSKSPLADKILVVKPESSIVGRIFNTIGETKIVKSKNKGPSQHDAISWKICGKDFVEATSFTESSDDFSRFCNNWAKKMTKEETNDFIEALYTMIRATNATTLSEISEAKIKFIFSVLRTDEKTKKAFWAGISKLLKERRIRNKEKSIISKNLSSVKSKKAGLSKNKNKQN